MTLNWYKVKVIKRYTARWQIMQIQAETVADAVEKARPIGVPVYACENDRVVWHNTDPEDRRFLESAR